MIPIQAESLDFKLSGYAALPEVNRSNRNYISTIVNGRFIKNYALVRAIQDGYHTLLPIGRFPILVLQIEMDPLIVDVNVHPAKLEVRLSKEAELGQFIANTLKAAFHKEQLIPDATPSKKQKIASEQLAINFDKEEEKADTPKPLTPPTYTYQPSQSTAPKAPTELPTSDALPNEPPLFINEDLVEYDTSQTTEEIEPKERMPKMYPVGQVHATYIVAQNETGMYLIDQHAAQERIKYEFYREKIGEVDRELQQLLVPIVLDFSTDEFIKLRDQKAKLEEVGVFLENFGQNSFIIREHPTWLPKGEEESTLRDILDEALTKPQVSIHKLREDAAIMMSCKKSIKANHYLTQADMEQLLDTLRDASDPFTCPHGRPVIISYSTYELEKMFKRIM